MHNLTEFLSRNVHWFSLHHPGDYQWSFVVSFQQLSGQRVVHVGNYVAGIVYEQEAKLLSFLSLRENNELLTKRNLELEQQLKNALQPAI